MSIYSILYTHFTCILVIFGPRRKKNRIGLTCPMQQLFHKNLTYYMDSHAINNEKNPGEQNSCCYC